MLDASVGPVRHANSLERHPLYDKQRCHEKSFQFPVPYHGCLRLVGYASKDTVHEMIVVYMKDPTKALPYIDKENRAGEDKSVDKGEVSELDPGKSGSVTVALKPGKYLLICN